MTPPLKAAIGIVSPSGSTSMRRPRGGRPLVIVKITPASRIRLTASIARGVITFSFVTTVPSTSASSTAIDGEPVAVVTIWNLLPFPQLSHFLAACFA